MSYNIMKLGEELFNKTARGLTGLAFIAALGGCNVGIDASNKIDPPGIYECKPKEENQNF